MSTAKAAMLPCPAEVAMSFKEWASVCLALAQGRQSVILRKGGIAEGPGGFRPEHDVFWLYPTQFHQSVDQLAPADQSLLTQARDLQPPAGTLLLRWLVVVEETRWLSTIDDARRLRDRHVWSDEVVTQRFSYRNPGLYAFLVRTYELAQPHMLPERPSYGGCKSWTPLDQPLSTSGLQTVLSDAQHAQHCRDLADRWASAPGTCQ